MAVGLLLDFWVRYGGRAFLRVRNVLGRRLNLE